jgi:hypothetical protein
MARQNTQRESRIKGPAPTCRARRRASTQLIRIETTIEGAKTVSTPEIAIAICGRDGNPNPTSQPVVNPGVREREESRGWGKKGGSPLGRNPELTWPREAIEVARHGRRRTPDPPLLWGSGLDPPSSSPYRLRNLKRNPHSRQKP